MRVLRRLAAVTRAQLDPGLISVAGTGFARFLLVENAKLGPPVFGGSGAPTKLSRDHRFEAA